MAVGGTRGAVKIRLHGELYPGLLMGTTRLHKSKRCQPFHTCVKKSFPLCRGRKDVEYQALVEVRAPPRRSYFGHPTEEDPILQVGGQVSYEDLMIIG